MKKVALVLLLMLVTLSFSACNVDKTISKTENKESKEPEKIESVVNEVTETKKEEVKEEEKPEETEEKSNSQEKVEEEINIQPEEPEKQEPAKEVYTEKTLIATGSTVFNLNNYNRKNNIELAANYISGTILNPGEEFSFNNVVGKRTAEKGFLAADIFSGNQVVKGIGGGICQTSTTLCIAVKQTDMKILEQNPHSKRVSYAKYEDEAMINYGTSDFRFLNTYDSPITIEFVFTQNSGNETITCNIYLLK